MTIAGFLLSDRGMDTKPDQAHSDIAATFDRRAPSYNRNDWHRRCAEQLTVFCGIVPGQVVLDAGTGTGLVAILPPRTRGFGAASSLSISRSACYRWPGNVPPLLPKHP